VPKEPMEFAVAIFLSSLLCLIPIYLINVCNPLSINLRTLLNRKNSHES
jgi:PST family polysaccharide transporter